MANPVATYPKLRQDWLKHEHDTQLYRREVTLLSGAGELITGTVLGKITKGAASSAAKSGGNTGGGSLTLDGTPKRAGCKPGIYTVRCVAVAANGGSFQVTDPDGVVLGIYAIGGTAFTKHVAFAMADSGTDFALGDGFDITVAAGSGKWKKHINGAVDGTEVAAGILLDYRDATSADAKAVIVDGPCEIAASEVTWDSSVDDSDKKAAALAQLALLGMQYRRVQ